MQPDWGIVEGGAAGPSVNPSGDPSGHAWVAVAVPDVSDAAARNVLTGNDNRAENMVAFAIAALQLFHDALQA